ncbi:G patch domain-containing protein 2 isoform X2 [Atheta coriaria]|uniref:G patch domain-containing protein 2 isoform X2 n=1 Tax=Dalotia coriaria TaxID=877792 RepID=UPI0031F42DC3
MEQLAQDLTVALEESESCGPIALQPGRKWGMRRRTRSAGNLHICVKSCDNRSEDSTSSNSEVRAWDQVAAGGNGSVHHSDSDDMSVNFQIPQCSAVPQKSQSMKLKNTIHPFIRGMSHSLESDSFNEHSPARPSIRRKRKLKRMSVDETPVPPVGKRKRPQRVDIEGHRGHKDNAIKPLHQSVLDKLEKFCQPLDPHDVDCDRMETQCVNDSCELASESSLSWSGGEGHEGDDELTDWAPSQDPTGVVDQPSWSEMEAREFRSGCRRVREERPGFSINTNANERVARFLQDATRSELRLCGTEREKLHQLAALYSLELWFDGPTSSLLRKTNRTPCMQPTQRHHSGHTAGHKRIRTQDHVIT